MQRSDWHAKQVNAELDKGDDDCDHEREEFFAHREIHLRRLAVWTAVNQLNVYQRIEFRKPVLEVFEGEPIRLGINVALRFLRQRILYEFKALVTGEVRHQNDDVERFYRFQPTHETELSPLDYDYNENYPHIGRRSAFNQGCFEYGKPKKGYTIYANDLECNAAQLIEDLQYPKFAWTIPKEVRSGYPLNLLISPGPQHQAAFEEVLGFLARNGKERERKALLRAVERQSVERMLPLPTSTQQLKALMRP